MKPRDMTRKAFIAALKRHGITVASESVGEIHVDFVGGAGVYTSKSGTRRGILADLIRSKARYEETVLRRAAERAAKENEEN